MITFSSPRLVPQKRSCPGPSPSVEPWSIPTKSSMLQVVPLAPRSIGFPHEKEELDSVSHLMEQKFSSIRMQMEQRKLLRYRTLWSTIGPQLKLLTMALGLRQYSKQPAGAGTQKEKHEDGPMATPCLERALAGTLHPWRFLKEGHAKHVSARDDHQRLSSSFSHCFLQGNVQISSYWGRGEAFWTRACGKQCGKEDYHLQ